MSWNPVTLAPPFMKLVKDTSLIDCGESRFAGN